MSSLGLQPGFSASTSVLFTSFPSYFSYVMGRFRGREMVCTTFSGMLSQDQQNMLIQEHVLAQLRWPSLAMETFCPKWTYIELRGGDYSN